MLKRLRRTRQNEKIRNLLHENNITLDDLIYPMFVVEGENIKKEISSMPNIYHYSLDNLKPALDEVVNLGINAVLFFGLPSYKDEVGSCAYDDDGIVQKAIRLTKKYYPDLIVIADICLCEYTSHGHCGLIDGEKILNDESVELLAKMAVSCARSGADIVAPSDMMDGRVLAIRNALDKNNMENVLVLSYSVKYASGFYGPFREAVASAPIFGDRKTYQMDYRNSREAFLEVQADLDEGADLIMVKPALAYLDIIKSMSDNFHVPVVAYQVSGEYSMIKAGANNGWIDEKSVVMESMTAIKRAGARIIITYYALEIAKWIGDIK